MVSLGQNVLELFTRMSLSTCMLSLNSRDFEFDLCDFTHKSQALYVKTSLDILQNCLVKNQTKGIYYFIYIGNSVLNIMSAYCFNVYPCQSSIYLKSYVSSRSYALISLSNLINNNLFLELLFKQI